jgi:hypothetical protein
LGSAARHGTMKVFVGCPFSCSQKYCFWFASRHVSLRPLRAVESVRGCAILSDSDTASTAPPWTN